MMNSSGPPPYPASTMGRTGAGNNAGATNTAGAGYEFSPVVTSSSTDFNSTPLSHLSDATPALDPLNAMEKSLNEQVCNHFLGHLLKQLKM